MVSHDIEFCAQYADAVAMFLTAGWSTNRRAAFAENSFYTTAANRMSRHLFLCRDGGRRDPPGLRKPG